MSNILEETQIYLNGNVVLTKGNDSTVGLYKVLFEVNDIERYRFAIKYKTKEKTMFKLKWSIENIYEYVLLTTPIPEVSIGASVILPDFIKNIKSIVSFQYVTNNLCFWYCFARYKYPEIRLDRLSKKAKDLYKDYYKTNVKKCYPKLDIQELEEIESHFFVNVNIYRFNGKKAVMERHSGHKYLQSLYSKYSRFFVMMANLDDAKVQKRLRLQLLEWLGVLAIYGFNSSSYDIDIIKKYPPQVLKHSKKHGNVSKCEKL
ncbi:hypothetical protein BATDEDRAFT_28413 [Batrachochytrium dendrobatidis JAM81]|uniref:Uncharacterized protein n=1 Tax=Batrachochytrium dendrobatidis (strain JAM81 / FGSC 10211) TaxID=684364 RepID=F4PE17_BATDJ|nr:uncharacterized protein BATDEDRAFT_28413 [Batrachochytrium dendrobatidis JAM81]EGF76579.1 hypothetical protein BATDEDRAFT_28413 [Batrachochytrium dendrobatidis JAM81]|eukprot:XP_006682808.1 hypothetical protein BATDEDRAFT_28413 [Batrachochytrium dendrobatidis JAM81]